MVGLKSSACGFVFNSRCICVPKCHPMSKCFMSQNFPFGFCFPRFWNFRLFHYKNRIGLQNQNENCCTLFLFSGSHLDNNQYFIHPNTQQWLPCTPEPLSFSNSLWVDLFPWLTYQAAYGTLSVWGKKNFWAFSVMLSMCFSLSWGHFSFSQKINAKHQLCQIVQ